MLLFQIFPCPWFLISFLVPCYGSLQPGFSKLQRGHRLDRKLIQSFTEVSFLDCVIECLVTPRCKSVNYFKGANFCEINYENKTTAETRYMESAGWVYSEKGHWPKELAGACSNSTCDINQTCKHKRYSMDKFCECVLSDCGIPDQNGIDLSKTRREDAIGIHRRIHALCADGYSQSGSGRLICQSNGEWKYDIVCTVLPNIASHKPAAQSSTQNKYNASYAVDGNRGTNVGVDKCAHTADGDMNPWWRVDLQDVYKVSSVRILNRGKDQYNTDLSHQLRNITVTVGLTESDVNTSCGVFAGPGTLSQLVVIDCPTLPWGRFVKISKTTEFLTLCEVDVFGLAH
nr:uncharacterized protein LOC105345276 [Crassostrea gigas]|eukprot:XP_019929678.1 PREDICTED: uncharacterized protein LOC105345276 [Crassostrea gigas]